ncbi:hypothetical protein AVEN_13676-1 [Araneus ventricosus]|uniref:THAP-type domain-containing protein n=1 Tax=Araneus ventricosus TaxID=182803 RepID=A0A4Y2MNU4_ARAVE|nr:hypothetical protein AVEN_13676-1 [Araneus ventricosus]
MPGCAVVGFSMYSRNYKGTNVSFHSFRKDPPDIRKIWIFKFIRKYTFNIANARISSRHFRESDYSRNLKAELLGIPATTIQKPKAVQGLNFPSNESVSPSEKSKRLMSRNVRKYITCAIYVY